MNKNNILVLFLFLGCLGCPTAQNTKKKEDNVIQDSSKLKDRVFNFLQHLRWKRYFIARSYLDPKLQRSFFLKWEKQRELRHIVSFAVRDVSFSKKGQADIWVEVKEYILPSVTVKRKYFEQKWSWIGMNWYLASETKMSTDPKAPVLPQKKDLP